MSELDLGKWGAPSFEEFCRNRDQYLGTEDEDFAAVDAGSSTLKRQVKKHIYEIEGYRCKTLEEVERVARNQGIPIRDLDYRPELIPTGGGKCDIVVKFVPKHEREKRNAWS
jgi:hypothetical protein